MIKLWKTVALTLVASGVSSVNAMTLSEAVQETIKTNPELLTQSNRRLSADAGIDIARAGYYPKVDLNAGIGYEKTDNQSTTPDDVELRREEVELTLRQMLYDGYATKTQVDAAESRVIAAANRVASNSESLGLSTVGAYLDVMRQSELLQLAKGNLQAHQDTYDQIKTRSEQGFDTSVDLEQAAGRLALAKSNLASIEGNLLDAESAYLRVVGVAAENLQLPASDCCSPHIPASLEEAIEQACSKHPELLVAIAELESSLSEQEGANSLHRPKLYLDLGASWNDNLDGVEGSNDDKYAMLRGEYNVYNGRSDSARNIETAHLSEAAKDNVRSIKRELDEAVRITWNAMEISEKTLPYLEVRAEASERTRNSYYDQFVIGQRTLLDLLDSENELFASRSELVEGRYDALLSQYRVMAALGTLLDSMQLESREEALIPSK